LPGGKLYLFGLFIGDIQVGFQCYANYVPHRKGTVMQFHSNRVVIHPDYTGLGLGIRLINATSKWMIENVPNIKVMAKFSAIPLYRARINDPRWKFLGERRTMGSLNIGGNMDRKTGFRQGGVRTFHFEYVGEKQIS
jgi:hypothetical protein